LIIQIIGLPGSGKTTLAKALLEKIDAVHLNADEVRATVNSDLGFSIEDRIENARRLGAIAELLSSQGRTVIVDFVCPTVETRKAFGYSDFLIWMDRIDEGRFADTNSIWQKPAVCDLRIVNGLSVEEEVSLVIKEAELFDWSAPTTLQLGRYQPWHEGHQALKDEAHKRTDQVLIGIRNTYGTSEKDPLTYEQVEQRIVAYWGDLQQNTMVMRLPNITNIVYGRDVGYKIEKVELPPEIQAISATQKRKELGI
jgi:ABC-type cobalamin/Fe3+-siderophores transport system ATPase subunit